jgi:hypothetical protein
MGPRKRQLLSTLYVALFALGGADSTGGFCLRTLSNSRPTTIVRHILDTVAISHTVDGTSCKELVRHVNLGLLRLVRAHRFASLVVTPQGYKAGGHPCAHLHPLA